MGCFHHVSHLVSGAAPQGRRKMEAALCLFGIFAWVPEGQWCHFHKLWLIAAHYLLLLGGSLSFLLLVPLFLVISRAWEGILPTDGQKAEQAAVAVAVPAKGWAIKTK